MPDFNEFFAGGGMVRAGLVQTGDAFSPTISITKRAESTATTGERLN